MNKTAAVTQGVHHAGLTVPDIEETGRYPDGADSTGKLNQSPTQHLYRVF